MEKVNPNSRQDDTSEKSEGHFTTSRGQNLYCRYWSDDAPANGVKYRGLIFIIHGAGEHCLCYNELAELLNTKGFYVFSHDHVGHGQSEGPRVFINDFKEYVEDIFHHIDNVKNRFSENMPVYAVGHSMGGLIAFLSMLERPDFFKGVVLIAPALQATPGTVSPLTIFFGKMIAKVLPQLKLQKLDSKLISRDPEEVKRYDADPLVYHHGLKCGWGVALLKAFDVFENRVSEIKNPFLVMHGDKDGLCYVEGSRILYEKSVSDDKEIKIYPDYYHQLHKEPKEYREVVLQDIVDWLLKRSEVISE